MKQNSKFNIISSGFSLLEVLVSLMILSILMVFVLQTVRDSIDSKYRFVRDNNDFLQIHTAMERIIRDFEEFYSPIFYELDEKTAKKIKRKITQENIKEFGQDPNEDEKKKDENEDEEGPSSKRFSQFTYTSKLVPLFLSESKSELVFFTKSNRRRLENSKQSSYAWVRYSLSDSKNKSDDDEASSGKTLYRQILNENIYDYEFNWDQIEKQVLAENIEDISYEFWDKEKEKFTDKVEFLKYPDNLAPRLIKVSLKWITSSESFVEEEHFIRVNIPYFNTIEDYEENLRYPRKDSVSNSTNESKKNDTDEKEEE